MLDDAFCLLPPGPPPRPRHKGGFDVHQRAAWNLATRLRDDADQVLRLLDDTRVPFDNYAEVAVMPKSTRRRWSGRAEFGITTAPPGTP
ncbi:MAG TPA: hypothetical protein VM142_04780, partial [Acidimicrobiales bacterium]|nr:hypothetical protein [Acidimicrobiales bacterium]